ncbi:hypothetical protein [Ruegeria hyattellae]|uniref:hypothetical protein n=1 Tax=Ruegeria hyattellae TaxID=3233337 RepID=UPI00355C52D4
MRMILVHGISQEGKSEQKILDEWLTPLRTILSKLDNDPLDHLSRIEAVFYGDLLGANSSPWLKSETLAMGAEDASDDFDEFAVEALEEMASIIGVTRADIEAEATETTVPMGKGPHKKWLKAIARSIENVSPMKGTIALRMLGQAHAYIRNQYVHDLVNDKVRPVFEDDEPAIIVSHSLGTIVSYALLREFARNGRPRQSPLWLTLGSPLGIDVVRKGFTKPRVRPADVSRWVNAADPEDFVALRPALDASDFGPDVQNISDVENGTENPHSIAGYLSDMRVAKAIIEAIP